MNNKTFYLIVSLFIFSFSFGQQTTIDKNLFSEVSTKLKKDKKSLEVFTELYQEYLLDLREENQNERFIDLYIQLYNKGIPVVRLLKKESFIKRFDRLKERGKPYKKIRLCKEFLKLTRNKKNYNTDIDIGAEGTQKQYFLQFLNEYKIMPATN